MLAFKRGRSRYTADFKIKDVYEICKRKLNHDLDEQTIKKILKDLNCYKVSCVIGDGQELYLPYRLGSIRIRKKKKKLKMDKNGNIDRTVLPVKWAETKKMWEKKYPELTPEEIAEIPIEEKGLVYNWNEHTNMYQFSFFWDRKLSNIKNVHFYTFRINRNAKELLARLLKEYSSLQYKYFE